jgi:thiol:disulfide interchange protein DsbA
MLVNAEGPSFEEGVHYQLVTPPVPTADATKVEVVEMFWYGCPHCFHFEPLLAEWLKTKPEGVTFRRLPAIFAKQWEAHARAMYAAEALGVLEKLHRPLFDAIHTDNRRLFDEESLVQFAGEIGIDSSEFRQAFNSPTVQGKVKMALIATRDYGIDGVPSIIVNGKYRITASMAGSQENLLKVVDFLIAKEKAH